MMGMKIFLGQNLLLVPFSDNSGKWFISIIGMKIFQGQNLLLVRLCYDSEKKLCKDHRDQNISKTIFIVCFFLVLVVKSVV